LFRVLAARDLVPKTFYMKFTEPDEAPAPAPSLAAAERTAAVEAAQGSK
jgi:hypothetical protein